MSNDELNQAIQLIQQGQNEQAQPILEALITTNPQDLAAWSWYVKSCRTAEKRLEALKVCLQFNPNNPQILEAIQKLQEKLPPQPKPAFDADLAPSSLAAVPEPSPYYGRVDELEAFSQSETVKKTDKFTGLGEVSGHPFAWYDVWWLALTKPSVDFYTALLQDPLASLGRAYWWAIMAALVTGLVSLASPSTIRLLENLTDTSDGATMTTLKAVVLVLWVPVGAVFNILILTVSTFFYNLLAKVFGGTGNFSRTFYLTAAFYAPFSMITTILSIIPFINCIALFLSFYGFRLNVAAIQAAHRLNGARATLVILLPAIAILLIFCVTGVIIGQTIGNMPEFQRFMQSYGR